VTATNVSRNLRRSARRHRALLARLPVEPDAPHQADRFDDGEAGRALRRLAELDQQVLVLCVLEGYSEGDAASALGVPPGTVKSRLSRARTRLARSYEGALHEA
jgi:DNA-directed RNA polymerase specialized sigma24 family protein